MRGKRKTKREVSRRGVSMAQAWGGTKKCEEGWGKGRDEG